MPNSSSMFLPISETATGSVFLPGLAGDPHSQTQAMFPPGTYPIMGSRSAAGDFTGTLYPLADPIVPQPMPLPPEVQGVAMPATAITGRLDSLADPLPPQPMPMPVDAPLAAMPAGSGATDNLPDYPMPTPDPQQIMSIPPNTGLQTPDASALAQPLPTSVSPTQMAWPPMPQPIPDVPLQQPMSLPLPEIPLQMPDVLPIPSIDAVAPGMLPLPGMTLQAPLPSPAAAEPLAVTQTPGMTALIEAMRDVDTNAKRLDEIQGNRNTLRGDVPQPNLGQVVWEQKWPGRG